MDNILDSVTKRAGTIGALQGTLYEIQVIFLFMIRACLNNVKFTLANNIDGFGNFDDLVASCELTDGTKKLVCLQCKHLKNTGKNIINFNTLTDIKEKSFNLNKYREEILKAGSKISNYKDIDVDLIFYTTVSIDNSEETLSWCRVDKNNILCKLLDTSEADNKCVRKFSQPGNDLLVENVGNDQEFIEKTTIFSSQCREENIEAVIKKSLCQLVGNQTDDIINNIYQNIKSELEKWFKNEKAASLCNKKFISWTWNNVLKEVPCLTIEEKLETFSLNYSIFDVRIEKLRNQIAEHRKLVIKSENTSTFLAALEVYQAVKLDPSHMFVNLQDLDQVLPLFKYCKDLIIIDCSVVTQKEIDDITKFQNILEHNNKKVIFLLPKYDKINIDLICEKVLEHKFDFYSLKNNTQRFIKSCFVKLQGTNLKMQDLLDDKAICDVIDCATVEKLLKHEVVKVCDKLPDLNKETEACYIERSYHNTHVLDRKVLDIDTELDVLVVCVERASDLGTHESHFVSFENINERNTAKKFYYIRKSIIENQKKINAIVTKYPSMNIHLLEKVQDNLLWYKTMGCSVAKIREYVTTCTLHNGKLSDTGENEDSLINSSKQLNIIVDSAGKGKTTALLKIAKKLKSIYKTCLVLHYDLNSNEMFDIFSSIQSSHKNNQIISDDILNNILFFKYTTFELAVILHLLRNNKVIFCFDGYDEISQRYDKECMRLMNHLQNVAKQIWLTSREHMESYIQQYLPTFPIKLLPITKQNQIEFYIDFFKFHLKREKKQINNQVIEYFASELYVSIARIDKSIVEFMGIPLLTKMVASINLTCINNNSESTITMKQIPVTLSNIFDLYHKFFVLSIARYVEEKEKQNLKSPYCNLETQKRLEYHIIIAFTSLMKEEFHSLLTEREREDLQNWSLIYNTITGVGIITSFDPHNVKFLHFTFAEFLMANFISNRLKNCNFNSQLQALLNEILHEDRWKIVRKFLNNSPYITQVKETKVNSDQKESFHIANFFRSVLLPNVRDKYNPLVKCFKNKKTLLHIAVEERNCNIAKFTIECLRDSERKKYISFQTRDVYSDYNLSALHLAVQLGHKEETKLLLNYNADNYIKEDRKGELLVTAAYKGHVDVLTLLLDRGADVNHKDKDGQTALIQGAWESHVDVVTLLLDRGADLHKADKYNRTAILTAAGRSTVETVKLLLERGASLNDKDKDGRTLLMLSACNRRNDVITYVISQGRYDIHDRDNLGTTALHDAAERGLSLNVKTLLDLDADINSQDDFGDTPLHWAVKLSTSLQCVQYLCQRGADRSVKNKSGKTVLDVECCNDEIKQWLRQNINICDIEVRGELTNRTY